MNFDTLKPEQKHRTCMVFLLETIKSVHKKVEDEEEPIVDPDKLDQLMGSANMLLYVAQAFSRLDPKEDFELAAGFSELAECLEPTDTRQ